MRADEVGGIEFHLLSVDLRSIVHSVEYLKVVDGAAHNVGKFEIFYERLVQFQLLGCVVLAKINIVVEYRTSFACILEKGLYLAAQQRVEHKVRAVDDNVVGLYIGKLHVEMRGGILFVEKVLGVVIFVEKGKRDGRFYIAVAIDARDVHAAVDETIDNNVAHAVAANLAHEDGSNAHASKRDDAVEDRAAGHCLHRTVVLEENVKNRLAYSYYLFHFSLAIIFFSSSRVSATAKNLSGSPRRKPLSRSSASVASMLPQKLFTL